MAAMARCGLDVAHMRGIRKNKLEALLQHVPTGLQKSMAASVTPNPPAIPARSRSPRVGGELSVAGSPPSEFTEVFGFVLPK
jgi:hypothetical protein